MTKAEIEPFLGSSVLVTVAIANLDAAQYVGRLAAFSGNAAPQHWAPSKASAPKEMRVVLEPLPSVPGAYAKNATNGLALCPIGAITSIQRL